MHIIPSYIHTYVGRYIHVSLCVLRKGANVSALSLNSKAAAEYSLSVSVLLHSDVLCVPASKKKRKKGQPTRRGTVNTSSIEKSLQPVSGINGGSEETVFKCTSSIDGCVQQGSKDVLSNFAFHFICLLASSTFNCPAFS